MGAKYIVSGQEIDVTDVDAVRALSEEDFAELLAQTLRDENSPRVDNPRIPHVQQPQGTAFAFFRGPSSNTSE